MSLSASKSQLMTLTRELARHWDQARSCWLDDKSREFAAKYLEPLQTQVTTALTAADKLDAIISRVRNDCE
jgi:hypothetical protein